MGIKLVVSDIDGTLIGDDRQITPLILEIGRLIDRKGIPFTLASGRIPSRLMELQKILSVDLPVIACNGGCAVHGSAFLWNDFIPTEALKKAIYKADQIGMSVVFTDGVKEFAYRKTDWIRELMEVYHRYDGIYAPKDEEWGQVNIQKVLISDASGEADTNMVLAELSPYRDQMKVVCYPDGTLDIMPSTANKGEGLRRLAQYLQIDLKDVMAIGDHENDVEMIQCAGIGVAVGNATASLKAAADYVCEKKRAEGVMEALRYYFGDNQREGVRG